MNDSVAENRQAAVPRIRALAIAGACLLFVGVFLPLIRVPILGSLNYFQNGYGDGTVIAVLAIASFLLAITNRFRALWATGLLSAGLLMVTVYRFAVITSQARHHLESELAGNPFSGLAEFAINSVQLEWGLAVLVLGAGLTISAAVLHERAIPASKYVVGQPRTQKLAVLAIVITVLIACAVNGGKACKEVLDYLKPSSAASTEPPGDAIRRTDQSINPVSSNPQKTDVYFADGTHVVGQDINAGTYRARLVSEHCYYARLTGFGGSFEEIVANENTSAPAIVTISANDKGFTSTVCGTWSADLSTILNNHTSFDDGNYIVNTDIEPGTYRTNGQHGCYYSRLSGFGGSFNEIIANENTDSPAVVTISPGDAGFKSAGCGSWSLVRAVQTPPTDQVTPSPAIETTTVVSYPSNVVNQTRPPEEIVKDASTRDVQTNIDGQMPDGIYELLEEWQSATITRNAQRVANCYAPVVDAYFRQSNVNQAYIQSDKENLFHKYAQIIRYQLSDIRLESQNANSVMLSFNKAWDVRGSDIFTGRERGQLVMKKLGAQWKIAGERELQIFEAKHVKASN